MAEPRLYMKKTETLFDILFAIEKGDFIISKFSNKMNLILCEALWAGIVNETFPIKHKFIRQKTLQNKWLNKELLQEIKLKDKLYARKLKNPTLLNTENYRIQLKKVEKSKKIEKRCYFRQQLDKYNTNLKKRWMVLR